MITAIVQLDLTNLPPELDIRKVYEGSVSKYTGFPGLQRKYYLLDEQRRIGGGVYLCDSREAADRLFNAEWRAGIQSKMGIDPQVAYFETPIVIDNAQDKVVRAAGGQ